MMYKRILITILFFTSAIIGYITFDPYANHLCMLGETCIFAGWRKTISEPLFIVSTSVFISSIFTFFISNRLFTRWLIFTIAWLVAAVICIALAPVYTSNILGGPTKESISIWMGTLFVIISLIMFAVMTWRENYKIVPQDKGK